MFVPGTPLVNTRMTSVQYDRPGNAAVQEEAFALVKSVHPRIRQIFADRQEVVQL